MNRRSMLRRVLGFLGIGAAAAAATVGPSWRPLLGRAGELAEVEDYVAADGKVLGFVWRYAYSGAPPNCPYEAVIPLGPGMGLSWRHQHVFVGTLSEAKAALVKLLA